jgi:glycosyltransferase involved in cell wall biosynthesis
MIAPTDMLEPIRQEPALGTIVHVFAVPVSLTFLTGQVAFMRSCGFGIHVITSPGPELEDFGTREDVPVDAVPMPRAITPLRDLLSLYRLWRVLRRVRPRIVHAHTAKGGLLGITAAWLARTPVRVYHLRALPFETRTGWRRLVLRYAEQLSCALAHRVIAVSHSLRQVAIDEGLCRPEKARVLLGGSGNGVDATGRFKPLPPSVRVSTRARYGIPEDALVVGFLGRLTRDKGVIELARAWAHLREREPRLRLLIAGRDELEPGLAGLGKALREDPRVHFTGPLPPAETPCLYAAIDVVSLPTYREGFPNVALEAAAMGLPIVATSVTGCVDAVQDGETGALVPVRDAEALARALDRYLSDPQLRQRHGESGRQRVLREFRREAIWEAIAAEYRELLAQA